MTFARKLESEIDKKSEKKKHIRYFRGWKFRMDRDASANRHGESWYQQNKDLQVIRPIGERFEEGLDYRAYCLVNKLSHYDEELARSVAKWTKCFQVQMSPQILDPLDSISILRFLSQLKLEFDMSRVHDGAAVWLLHIFEGPRHCSGQGIHHIQVLFASASKEDTVRLYN